MRASSSVGHVVACNSCGGPALYKFIKMTKNPRCYACKQKQADAYTAAYQRRKMLARSEAVVLNHRRRGLARSFTEHRTWMDSQGLGHLFEKKK
jgi:hypothetical protein